MANTGPTSSVTLGDVDYCPNDGGATVSNLGPEPETVIGGKYRVVAEIGPVGVGMAYLAKNVENNEDRMLTLLASGDQAEIEARVSKFQAMRPLTHARIARVEEAGYTEEGQAFVATELAHGETVGERLNSEGAIHPKLAVRLAAEICAALSVAHQHGVLHLGIAPWNLLLTRDAAGNESIRVMCAGLASVAENGERGLRGATPYEAPELLAGMNAGELDGRADIYSAGVVLYEMLTGRPPIKGSNGQATALGEARPDLQFPPELSAIVMKAISPDREKRFGGAQEMRGALMWATDLWRLPEKPKTAPKPEAVPAAGPRRKKRQEPQGLLFGTLAVVSAAAVVAVGMVVMPLIRENPVIKAEGKSPAKNQFTQPAALGVNSKDGLIYVRIPAGSFNMGCSPGDSECYEDEKPARKVTVGVFRIAETLVTQAAFEKVMRSNPSTSSQGPQFPVDSVRWDEAKKYCEAIGGELPTEAQWEYAARGGTEGPRYRDLDLVAWYKANSGDHTREVKQMAPNPYGLYDMLGNVWEWTADWYKEGALRAIRGGSWVNPPRSVRVSYRNGMEPEARQGLIGFRCVA